MSEAKFILSKEIVKEQVKVLEDLGLKVSYSYKTNKEVGDVLQEISECDFSIHAREEINMIGDKSKIWFFTQAELEGELKEIIDLGIRNFVVDNEVDLQRILNVINEKKIKISLSLRMRFQEHRVGSGKYFVYGMPSKKINELIFEIKDNSFIDKLGVHIHRKTQNTSEWDVKSELEDSLTKESLERLDFVNMGGGLPSKYRSYTSEVLPYVFSKIKESIDWLKSMGIDSYIEPGRFIAAPSVKLETEVIQVQGTNLIINTTIYNCALDGFLTGTKMLVEGELEDELLEMNLLEKGSQKPVPKTGEYYLIKGNSPTRDDIFRYKVKLKDVKVGNKIVFLNAGAYNYTTDFFGYKKLKTIVVEIFK